MKLFWIDSQKMWYETKIGGPTISIGRFPEGSQFKFGKQGNKIHTWMNMKNLIPPQRFRLQTLYLCLGLLAQTFLFFCSNSDFLGRRTQPTLQEASYLVAGVHTRIWHNRVGQILPGLNVLACKNISWLFDKNCHVSSPPGACPPPRALGLRS